MSERPDIHSLAAAYALDALDEDERVQFESHYPQCATCSAEVAEFRTVAAALAEDAAAAPPEELKASVMASIANVRQEPAVTSPVPQPRRRGRLDGRVVLAAAAAMVLIAGLIVAQLGGDAPTVEEVVDAPDVVAVSLGSLTEDHQGTLQVFWSAELDRVAVVGTELVDAGEGNAYALWALRGDAVAPAALFSPSSGAVSAVLEVDAADLDETDFDGWGITIEPEGGSEQPTTPVIYAGTI